jgi:hypothetical protein
MIPGAPHQEGTQRETHKRLEACFKSNKHESMPGDASSVLEMWEFKGLSNLLYLSLGITPLPKP